MTGGEEAHRAEVIGGGVAMQVLVPGWGRAEQARRDQGKSEDNRKQDSA